MTRYVCHRSLPGTHAGPPATKPLSMRDWQHRPRATLWQQWREVARNRSSGEPSVAKGALLTFAVLALIFGLCAALYAFMGVS